MVKKLLPWLIIIMVAIAMIAVTAFVLWEYVIKDPLPADPADRARASVADVGAKPLSAKEIKERTVMVEGITTNLADINHMIQISFAFQLSSKAAKEEFELLVHSVRAIIIETLADTSPNDIVGSAGQDALIAKLMNAINPILREGVISKLEITDKILTEF
jgi:flagellar FliL protein